MQICKQRHRDVINKRGSGETARFVRPGSITHFVISQETLSRGVFAGRAAAGFLVDISSGLVVGVTLAEGESTPVQRDSHDELVGRAALVFPELEAVVLRTPAIGD